MTLAWSLLLAAGGAACASFNPEVGPLQTPGGDAGGDGSGRADGAPFDGANTAQDASPVVDAGGEPAGPQVWNVVVGASGTHTFTPATLVIRAGDTVRWTWQSSEHSVTSGAGSPDGRFCSPHDTGCGSGQTGSSGDVYEHAFASPGTFPYFCITHPGMTGSITVQ